MAEHLVYITRQIPAEGIELLIEKGFKVVVHDPAQGPGRDEMHHWFSQASAVVTLLSDQIDRDLISHAPHLRIIANYAAGFNNIDLQAAADFGIRVSNTPDVLTAATADLTWALILGVAKRLVESDDSSRHGLFTGWAPQLLLGREVTGKTLGIVGAGRIGQAVGRRAAGFEMRILYTSRSPKKEFEQATAARQVSFETLISESDFISFHCALNQETRYLLNRDNFNMVKPGACIINTARGPVIEEKALADALKSGQLSGAGLDVYEHEPQIEARLLKLPNVILLPHIGSATTETRAEMSRIAARNIIEFFNTGRLLNPVL